MIKTIKIVTYFSDWKSPVKRTGSLSGMNVINYILKVLTGSGYYVKIISPSWVTGGTEKLYISSEECQLDDHVSIIKAPSISGDTRLKNFIKKVFSRVWLIGYLLKNIKKDEVIFLYHEPTLMFPIKILKLIRKPNIIMINEELYSDIPKFSYLNKNKEINYLKKTPSAYIFPTILLEQIVNYTKKPYEILHGTYFSEKDRNCKFNDDKTHILYAGTFNVSKGGAVAVSIGEFLDENYHIHIIGFGSDSEKKELLCKLEEVQKKAKCNITFDGLKSGEEYIKFVQACDIGLSPQNPAASYNETSFPSKVLSYLSNGIRVVSVKIKALETSAVNDLLFYYDSSEPEKIADVIKTLDMSAPYDSRKKIEELDKDFSDKLTLMIKGFYDAK